MKGDLISDDQYEYITYAFLPIEMTTCVFGLLTNAINLVVFWKIGLRECVTTSFFYLSITDAMYLAIAFIFSVAMVMQAIEENTSVIYSIQPWAMLFYCTKLREMVCNVSVWTTTFLAVQRCLCVYMPLHFKSLFTTTRTMLILWTFTAYTLISYIPVFAVLDMTLTHDPIINRTRSVLRFGRLKNAVWAFEEAQNGIIFPVAAQIIVVGSLLVMARTLQSVAKIRQQMTTGGTSKPGQAKSSSENNKPTSTKPYDKLREDQNHKPKILKTKDLKVVKSVALVSTVFVICNTPKIISGLTRRFVPSFDINKEFTNTYKTLARVRIEAELINAAINIIIYLKFNPKFKQILCGREDSC